MAFLRATDVLSGKAQMPDSGFHCHKCDTMIRESITGCRRLADGKFACSDCYFEDLGDALEAFPILPPRIRRRG